MRRTNKFLEGIRYRLMWWIAPVKKETIEHGLRQEVDTWDTDEYDSARMIGSLLFLWDDDYFEKNR